MCISWWEISCSKQGQTREAFENYRKALEYTAPPYLKTELYRIIISDLDQWKPPDS